MKAPTLNRTLGLFTATLLVASSMIGSGVFKKIVPMAQTGLSENWILLAWLIAGIITLFGAFNLCSLTSLTEESGGIYEYLRLSFGNFFSFLFGWSNFTIIGTGGIAALAIVLSQTINTLLPLADPLQAWQHISLAGFIFPFQDSGIKAVAILFLLILTWINYKGVRKSGNLNNVFTMAKIIGIVILIVIGLSYMSPASQHHPAIPSTAASPGSGLLVSAVFVAMLGAMSAYEGWASVGFIAGEIIKPKKNIPLAILQGVGIAIALYLLVNYAYLHVLSTTQLAAIGRNEIGGAVVAKTLIGDAGKNIIIILIMLSVFSTLNTKILSAPRIYFRMAQEGFFFKKVAAVHARFRTPHFALLYTLVWSLILIISGSFEMLTNMGIFTIYIFYGLLAVAVLKMKRKKMLKVKVIGYPAVQIIIVLFSLSLVINTFATQPKQSLMGLALILSGVPFYYYFRKKNLAKKEINKHTSNIVKIEAFIDSTSAWK